MQYALIDGKRQLPSREEPRAYCPCCNHLVAAKCGQINVWHWAHLSKSDCDSFFEPETRWHRTWKSRVPDSWQERVIGPHRADIFNPNTGTVVELQHSPISIDEIKKREDFYNQMVWLFDGRKFRLDKIRRNPNDGVHPDADLYAWSSPHKTIIHAARPTFFDRSSGLLHIHAILDGRIRYSRPAIVYANWMKVEDFCKLYLS